MGIVIAVIIVTVRVVYHTSFNYNIMHITVNSHKLDYIIVTIKVQQDGNFFSVSVIIMDLDRRERRVGISLYLPRQN
jgi:hypothetical protein